MKITRRTWPLLGLTLVLAGGPAAANTIDVDGVCTLVDAITAANTDTATGNCPAGGGDDTLNLLVDVTLNAVNNNTDGPNGLPSITSNITINGNEHAIVRDEDSVDPFRIFHIATGYRLVLNDTGVGGGELEGYDGAGLLNKGILEIFGSKISFNVVEEGNGGGLRNDGFLSINASTFQLNAAIDNGDGGGLINASEALIQDSTFRINFVEGSGGGLANLPGGSLAMIRTTFEQNFALVEDDADPGEEAHGGGLVNQGTVTITNSTFSGNIAVTSGGALANLDSGTVTLTHITATGNQGVTKGGGVHNEDAGTTLVLERSLIAGNTSPAGPEVFNEPGGSVNADGFNLFGHDGNPGVVGFVPGANDVVPALGIDTVLDTTLADNGGPTQTHALVDGSPAINAAGPGCPPPGTDQRGAPRPVAPTCDIGSFEIPGLPNLAPGPVVGLENDTDGKTVVLDAFRWTVTIDNLLGTAPAVFRNGDAMLRDDLPIAAVYGVPVAVATGLSGPFDCAIADNVLKCTALGDVSIAIGGSLQVTFRVLPKTPGIFTNPPEGGICEADPYGVVPEFDDTNNACGPDTVIVNPRPRPIPALNAVGLSALVLGLAGLGGVLTRRRRGRKS